jgi:thiol reductant ABC exporter CydD subunit
VTNSKSTTCTRRLFRLALAYKRYLALIGVATFLAAVAVIFQMTSLGRIIDGAFLRHLDLRRLHVPFVWLIGAIFLRASAIWLTGLVAQEIAIRIKEQLRAQLLRRLIDLGPLFTQREKTGELVATSVDGVEKLDGWYVSFLPHGLAMAIVPVTIAGFVTSIDWPSGLVLMFTGPLIPIFMTLIGISAKQKIDRQWSALQRMSGHFLDVLQGLPTLHLLGRSSLQAANIKRVSEEFRGKTMRVLYVAFLSGLVLELAASISTAIVAVEIGVRLIEGLINFQTGLVVLVLAPEFYLPFRLFGASHHAGMEGAAAGERIYEILDASSDADRAVGTSSRSSGFVRLNFSSPMPDSRGHSDEREIGPTDLCAGLHVRFEDVDYQYPGSLIRAIHGLCLELVPGRIHLLTGHSGAGKSTLIKLLLQLLQPTRGTVFANGEPLTRFAPKAWRAQIALVPQHPHFFDGSILDNLRIVNRDASMEQIRAAARLAEADEFILALPEGYHAPISEAAKRFSGGERQRLGIARAFLKDSPLLLFDEPASHLDAETAAKLQRAIIRLARHRTTLIVAHHGFASSEADDVFELSGGRLRSNTDIREIAVA